MTCPQKSRSIAAKDPAGNTAMHYAYTYDSMDNITQKVTEHGIYGYDYDDLYRLTGVTNPAAAGANEAYTYDAVGNRLTSAAVTGDWQYNANNELQSYGNVTYNYDNNGSMTEKSVGGVITRFFYNLEGRLERVEDGGGSLIATYYYDPFGRRLWKDVGGVRTHFHYSDEGLVGEYDGSGIETKTYGYKPDSIWSTDPLFMKIGSEFYWYQTDHMGVPQLMATSNGAVVWAAKYDSFGKAAVDASSTVENNLRFTGQYYDAETGLHYNYFRHYDPDSGRYISPDPIGLLGGDHNFYAYVWNDPVNWSDGSGLIPVETVADIIFIGLDIYNLATAKCNKRDHLIALGLDSLGLILPYVTGLGKAHKAARLQAPCFVAGTLVHTSEGLKSIEDIQVGEYVLSRDEETGRITLSRVSRVFVTPDQEVLELEVEDENGRPETFGTTAEHPFWVKAKGWTSASDLLPGDEIFTSSGGWVKVSGSTWLSERQVVYNLEVEETHTYFVGESGAWVHNVCHVPRRTERVRHYTNSKGFKGIESDGLIKASDQNSVFTVKAKGKPGSPRDVERSLGIKRGRGNYYVEFDASPNEFRVVKNPQTGAIERVFKGNVNLKGRNAKFKKNR